VDQFLDSASARRMTLDSVTVSKLGLKTANSRAKDAPSFLFSLALCNSLFRLDEQSVASPKHEHPPKNLRKHECNVHFFGLDLPGFWGASIFVSSRFAPFRTFLVSFMSVCTGSASGGLPPSLIIRLRTSCPTDLAVS
jgi:hypothetical protein